ncbi:MAG: MotA/TolQ/ExbB proton channel family protein, partial [bacterium]
DANMINKHTKGPKFDSGEGPYGFMQNQGNLARNSKVFRSLLLQIHYQNILRTFEQGNRRTWVDQDASIADLHTLLTQRGMKLVWTMIEVLPQLGLLGTLIGLMRMFTAFQPETVNVGILLSGLGTALGTTVVANVLVLVLRPLYMRNERTMNEVLSTIQTLMATFILPTQETVLERTLLAGFGRTGFPQASTQPASAPSGGINEARLVDALGELSGKLGRFTDVREQVDSGAMAEQTAEIAEQVRDTLRLFAESVDRDQMAAQRQAFQQLTLAIQGLERNLNRIPSASARETKPASERIERDLTQLRVLTHDTLLLLEQIAGRLAPDGKGGGRMLSTDRKLREQVFSGADQPASKPGQGEPAVEKEGGEGPGPVRLFKGPA